MSGYMLFALPSWQPISDPDIAVYRVRGGPVCECIEKMPVVSRADCTTYSSQGLVSCEDNDLRTHYEREMQSPGGELVENLVGTCPNA